MSGALHGVARVMFLIMYHVSHMKPYVSSVVLPYGMMLDRVERLAADIRKDYGPSTPHFLCVLKVLTNHGATVWCWRF